VLSLNVWDILVAEQPSSEERHIVIWSRPHLDLKREDYEDGIFCAIHWAFQAKLNCQNK
jgi:hypothetical protein